MNLIHIKWWFWSWFIVRPWVALYRVAKGLNFWICYTTWNLWFDTDYLTKEPLLDKLIDESVGEEE